MAAAKAPARLGRAARTKRAPRQIRLDFDGAGEGHAPPPTELLDPVPEKPREPAVDADALQENARLLESVLEDFGVKGAITRVRPGPVVTLYELEPAPGTKSSRVIGLADDVARSMSAVSVRIAVVPGRSVIGIEAAQSRARDGLAARTPGIGRPMNAPAASSPWCSARTSAAPRYQSTSPACHTS